jgi:hypothetical protein
MTKKPKKFTGIIIPEDFQRQLWEGKNMLNLPRMWS